MKSNETLRQLQILILASDRLARARASTTWRSFENRHSSRWARAAWQGRQRIAHGADLGRTVRNVGLACARTASEPVWIPTLQKETSLMLRSNKIMEKTQLKRSNASRSSIPSDIQVPLLRNGESAQYMPVCV